MVQEKDKSLMDLFNGYLLKYLIQDTPYYKDIIQQINDNKGKQLRAKLCLLCASLGGLVNDKSYRAAMIVEMLHTASLLHDDIVDKALERRGVPSINAKWGNKVALLSGDIISLKALLLSLSNADYDLLTIYSAAIEKIVEGELLQLRRSRQFRTTEEVYFKIIKGKTAMLFSAACKAGAGTTMHNKEEIKQIALLGEYLGLAFQIRDDLFEYETNNTGKPNDNDFKEHKLTLPLIHVLGKADYKLRKKIKRKLGRKIVQNADVEWIVHIVKQNGGVNYAENIMRDFGEKAINILNEFPDCEAKTELEKIIRFTIERNY